MMIQLVTLLTFLAVTRSDVNPFIDLEDNTAYNYLAKIGLPLAEEIRKYEEINTKIAGGLLANVIPYQAALLAEFSLGRGVCGGSLISNQRVLTAAHCWYDGKHQATSFTVVLGSRTLFSGGTRINSSQVIVHQNWIPEEIRNDIAIIQIEPVVFSNNISPIALPFGFQLNETFIGDNATASGYGLTGDNTTISAKQVLSQVNVPVIPNTLCSVPFLFMIHSSNICTSGLRGRSTCKGDSGGPLVVQRDGRPILVGIVSFGSSSGCTKGFPAVFTRVTSFMSFINEHL